MMDLGGYMVLSLRQMLGTEPDECIEATPRIMPEGFDQNCDQAMKAKWRFPNGAIGEIEADLASRGGYPLAWLTSGVPSMRLPKCYAVHREVAVKDDGLTEDQEHVYVKTITFWTHMFPQFWHRIDISEKHIIRNVTDKKIIKTWTETSYKKAYTWDVGSKNSGEVYWSTYRHQLEQFVNRIKGRAGSGIWMDGEDSIKQMEVVDGVYKKAGLPIRPTSSYR